MINILDNFNTYLDACPGVLVSFCPLALGYWGPCICHLTLLNTIVFVVVVVVVVVVVLVLTVIGAHIVFSFYARYSPETPGANH